ncbi:MAG: cytochrome c [Acidobacteriia bacterium]|nr:cytochrome c [Terriglobia bacterium]
MNRLLYLLSLAAIGVGVHYETRAVAPAVVRQQLQPVAGDAAARGRLLYQSYGCGVCHGAEAKGGFANPNSETEGKVPGLTMVKEGYLERELVQKILDGAPRIGKADAKGQTPPYRMPGWKDRMTRAEATDLARYLISLYPKKAAEDKWR